MAEVAMFGYVLGLEPGASLNYICINFDPLLLRNKIFLKPFFFSHKLQDYLTRVLS